MFAVVKYACYGKLEIRRAEAREKGNESVRGTLGGEKKGRDRPLHAPDFLISRFSLSFPRFLAISPLKEPLQRRELLKAYCAKATALNFPSSHLYVNNLRTAVHSLYYTHFQEISKFGLQHKIIMKGLQMFII